MTNYVLGSNLSLMEGFSIQDDVIDVAQSAPQGAHYHAMLFICSLNWELKRGHEACGTPGEAYTNSVSG